MPPMEQTRAKLGIQDSLGLLVLLTIAVGWIGWLWFFRRIDENTGLFTMSGIGMFSGAVTGLTRYRTWLAALFGTVIGGFAALGILAIVAMYKSDLAPVAILSTILLFRLAASTL